eukprot:1767251-Rhodomonas_salina.2
MKANLLSRSWLLVAMFGTVLMAGMAFAGVHKTGVADNGVGNVNATSLAKEQLCLAGLKQHSGKNTCLQDQRWLFVWGTGRSGSTTLMHMLNALPGIALSGENAMVQSAVELWKEYRKLQPRSGKKRGPWEHGAMMKGEFLCSLRKMFHSIHAVHTPSTTSGAVTGFKEIRFEASRGDVEFLKDVFPCARIVFNIRHDVEEQSKSGFHAKHNNKRKKTSELSKRNKEILSLHAEMGPQQSYLLALEDFNTQNFNKLAEWLGYKDCSFTTVLHDNDSKFGDYKQDTSTDSLLHGACIQGSW